MNSLSDILLNNSCEVFNKFFIYFVQVLRYIFIIELFIIALKHFFTICIRYILEAREVPILSMIEKIMCGQLMNRIYTKQKEAQEKWNGTICPKIKKSL